MRVHSRSGGRPDEIGDQGKHSTALLTNMAKKEKVAFEEEEIEVKTPKHEAQEPNVIFVGKKEVNQDGKRVEVVREAPKFINTPSGRISLPDSDTQQKGFYHPKANFLKAHFPDDYK